MQNIEVIKPLLNKMQQRALLVGALGVFATAVGAFISPEQFFKSYLFGYIFWTGLTLGSLAILSLHHMVGGGWGFVIQRVLESGTRTLPLMALLFLPILFGMKELYLWARPEVVSTDAILLHKSAYLNIPFFAFRAFFMFAVWAVFVFFMNKWSGAQDKTADDSLSEKLRSIGGPALLVCFITITFASIDWVMSLDPHWFSTIFGVMLIIGQGVSTLAFAIIVVSRLAEHKPLAGVIQKKHFHDHGNLLLAFLALWAYMGLSQFLIIWSGNLPEEIPWYLHRLQGGWGTLAILTVFFHFIVPFFLLLMRGNKRSAKVLSKIAMAIILVRFLDLFWIIMPNFYPHGFHIHWLDFAAPIGIGGVWVAVFVWQLKGRALLPVNDPRLIEVFAHE